MQSQTEIEQDARVTYSKLCGYLLPPVATALAISAGLALPIAVHWARAADHRDSPAVEADPATDINDIYAFRKGDHIVVAMTVQPSLRISGKAADLFNPRARYQFFAHKVSGSSDTSVEPNATVTVTFSGSNPQVFKVEGLTGTAITGPVTAFDAVTPLILPDPRATSATLPTST